MPVTEALLGLALSFLKKRNAVSNFEMQKYLDCNDETLKWIIDQLIFTNAAKDVNNLGLQACTPLAGNIQADIFLSYTRADSDITNPVVDKLRHIHSVKSPFPLRLFVDTDNMHYVKKWEPVIMQAIEQCSIFIPVISKDYFLSEYCKKEWELFYEKVKNENGESDNITGIYVSTSREYEAGNSQSDWISHLKQHQHFDLRNWKPDKNSGAYDKEFYRFHEDIISTIIEDKFDNRETYRIPPRRFSFTGRNVLLNRINALLRDHPVNKKLVLQGLSGIGKTTLAFQYAYLNRRYYTGGCFITELKASSDLREAINSIAVYLDSALSVVTNPEQRHSAVIKALEHNGPTLIILDNVNDPVKLSITEQDKYLPIKGNVHFLLTSQLTLVDFKRSSLEVLPLDFFSEEESISLLSKFRVLKDVKEKEAAARMHTLAGGLPIAIEIIGSYLWIHENTSYHDYCKSLEEKKIKALDKAIEERKKDLAVSETKIFSLIFEDINESLNVHEGMIMELASYMSPDNIEESWLLDLYRDNIEEIKAKTEEIGEEEFMERLAKYMEEKKLTERKKAKNIKDALELLQWIKDDMESIEERFDKSRDRLEGVQLFLRGTAKNWRIHHLVQGCTLLEREKSGLGQHTDKIVFDYLFNQSDRIITHRLIEQPEYRSIVRSLMGYYEYAMPRWADSFWGAVSTMSFSYFTNSGDIMYSKKILELAHKHLTNPLGKHQISMLLKQIYHAIGDKEGIEKIESQTENSVDVSGMLVASKLVEATNLMNAGRIDESLTILMELLDSYNRIENKTWTMFEALVTVKNNISILCEKKNMMQNCIQYGEESIKITEQLYPDGNLVLAERYNNLGANYTLIADFDKAALFAEKARLLYDKLGLKQNKAYAYNLKLRAGITRDAQAARDLTAEALSILIKFYGEKSPYLGDFYNQLATLEYQLGNYKVAFGAVNKAIDIITDLHGPDHRDLLHHYMLALRILGDWHTSPAYKAELAEKYGHDRFPDAMLQSGAAVLEMEYNMAIARLIQVNQLPEKTLAFAEFYAHMGQIELKRSRIEPAVQLFAFALSISEYLKLYENIPAEQTMLYKVIAEEFSRLYEAGYIKESLEFLHKSFRKVVEVLGHEHPIANMLATNLLKIQSAHMDQLIPELEEPVKRYLAAQSKSSEKKSFWGKLWSKKK